jgi:hypothetical protein
MCDPCPGGYYCVSGTADYSPFPCQSGYYCPEGTEYTDQYPCPSGTYNPDMNTNNETACKLCDPGKYCNGAALDSVSADCAPGYYCTGGASDPRPTASGKHLNKNYFILQVNCVR